MSESTVIDILGGEAPVKEEAVEEVEVVRASTPTTSDYKTLRAGRFRHDGGKLIFGEGETLNGISSELAAKLKANGFI